MVIAARIMGILLVLSLVAVEIASVCAPARNTL